MQVTVEPDLVIKQQQAEVHLVDTLLDVIQVDIELGPLHCPLLAGDARLRADGSAIKHRLLYVKADAVLVSCKPFHV